MSAAHVGVAFSGLMLLAGLAMLVVTDGGLLWWALGLWWAAYLLGSRCSDVLVPAPVRSNKETQ